MRAFGSPSQSAAATGTMMQCFKGSWVLPKLDGANVRTNVYTWSWKSVRIEPMINVS